MHVAGIRQTVQAIKLTKNCMRTNDVDTVRFKFKYGVEIVSKGTQVMMTEGNTKAIGVITAVYPMSQPPTDLVDKFTKCDNKAGLITSTAPTATQQ